MQNIKGVLKDRLFHPRKVVGLDLDARKIIVTELEKRGSEFVLNHFYIKEFSHDDPVENLKEFLKDRRFTEYNCIGAVSAEKSFFKSFVTRTNIFKDRKKIPSFLSRQSLPVNLSDCYWDYFLVGNNLNLVAARKEIVDMQFNVFKEMGIHCPLLTAAPFALYNVFAFNYPDKKNFCILHIRWACSNLFIFEEGKFWIHTISIGKNKLMQSRDTESLGIFDEFAQEIKRLFNSHYLQKESLHRTFSEIFLSGEPIDGISESLSVALGVSVNYLNPLQKITSHISIENPSQLSLSIGLCLSYLNRTALKLNLLKEKQKAIEGKVRINVAKKVFAILMAVILIILIFFNLRLNNILNSKKKELKKYKVLLNTVVPEYKSLLSTEDFIKKRLRYLEDRINLHNLWLRILADISLSKHKNMRINFLDAETTDNILIINLAGETGDYNDINDFLSALRTKEYVSGVKIISSTPSIKEDRGVEFKVRLDLNVGRKTE